MSTLQELYNSGFNSNLIKKAFPGLNVTNGNLQPNQLRDTASQQPAQSQEQAEAGNSENADLPPDVGVSPQNNYIQAILSQNAIDPQMRKQIEGDVGKQREGISYMEQLRDQLKNAPLQNDLSPLLALSDSLTGSKLAGSYQRPETGEQRIKGIADLQNMSQNEREKLIGNLTKLAIGKSNQRALGNVIRGQQADTRQITRWQDSIHNGVKDYTAKVDQAENDLRTMNDPKAIMTEQLFSELNTGLATLLGGGKGTVPVSREEHQRLNSLQQWLGKNEQFVKGKPIASIPIEFQDLMRHSFERLHENWGSLRARKAEQIASGIPYDRLPGSDKYINRALGAYGTSLPGSKKAQRAQTERERTESKKVESKTPQKRAEDMTIEELQAELGQ